MNRWIRNLNFLGGIICVTFSLLFLSQVIQANRFDLELAICVSSERCSRDIFDKKAKIAENAYNNLNLYSILASLGGGLACLRERKD